MNKVLTVVVTYNRLKLLKECLLALFSQTVRADILVVNNASTDGTAEYLATLNEKIIALNLEKNGGGAGGFYEGMKYGVEKGYEYLYLLDDDTVAEPDALEKLLDADKDLCGNYGFLASLALFSDGTPAKMNTCMLPSKSTADVMEVFNNRAYFRTMTATFVSFFIKTETVKKYGYPIKEFFIWSDDIEFTTRITKKEKAYFVPQSIVKHKMARNENADLTTMEEERLPRMVLNIRNRYYIARRDGIKKKLRFYARHFILWNKVLFTAKSCKLKRLKVIINGILKGWAFRPKVEIPQ